MSNLTKKAKGAIIGSVAGLAAIAVGVGIWQPWKADEPDTQVDPPRQEDVQPQPPEEEQLTLNVGGEKIPCTLYEGDGWSIWVPEGWEIDANENGGIFYGPSENRDRAARVEVIHATTGAYESNFVSISRQDLSPEEEWRMRRFYTGTEKESWELVCQSSAEEWSVNEKLMTALARSFAVGEERPFSDVFLAHEPDWQIADGKTILWLDKDGYVVSDEADMAVRAAMRAWDDEMKPCFTGRYRVEDLTWASSVTVAQGDYMDTFDAWAWYEVVEEKREELAETLFAERTWDGDWMRQLGKIQVVIRHGGSEVTDIQYLGLDTYWE